MRTVRPRACARPAAVSASRPTHYLHGSAISMDKDELLERYEAFGEADDLLAAKALF